MPIEYFSSKPGGQQLAIVAWAMLIVLVADRACAENATNVTTYNVKGMFKESRSAGRKAIIKHEAIPGYMEAMTMPFNVKQPAELNSLQPGDQITFRLSVTDTNDWIDEIKKTGERGLEPSKPANPQVTHVLAELQPGAMLPDSILTNQFGQAFHLRESQGRVLAFTFFFSRCPLPSYCPRMSSHFAAVQKTLLADNTKTNWQLLSISFDPEFDTPSRLANYAQAYHCDPLHWTFATSSPEEISQLGGAFGLIYWPEGGSINHNLRTVVVDASGRVRKIFTDNEWEPTELADEMKKALEIKP